MVVVATVAVKIKVVVLDVGAKADGNTAQPMMMSIYVALECDLPCTRRFHVPGRTRYDGAGDVQPNGEGLNVTFKGENTRR